MGVDVGGEDGNPLQSSVPCANATGFGWRSRRRRPGSKTFDLIPSRWRVERTFARLGRNRRLSKGYEETTSSSEAFVKLAMIHLMARRLVKKLAEK